MIIKGLQKTTLLDFPGKVACTVFTGGCNFRCPFCHNASLVLSPAELPDLSEEEFFDFLTKRRGILDGVCITGGEPLLQKDIIPFLERIRALGFGIKLDTNGYNPEKLIEIVNEGLCDYVAMDIKNSPDMYPKTVGVDGFDVSPILESAEFLMKRFKQGTTGYLSISAVSTSSQNGNFYELSASIGGALAGGGDKTCNFPVTDCCILSL